MPTIGFNSWEMLNKNLYQKQKYTNFFSSDLTYYNIVFDLIITMVIVH